MASGKRRRKNKRLNKKTTNTLPSSAGPAVKRTSGGEEDETHSKKDRGCTNAVPAGCGNGLLEVLFEMIFGWIGAILCCSS